MLSRKPSEVPQDLQRIDSALRDLRPQLPEDRVHALATRARMRGRATVTTSRIHNKESFLRSRLAITLMLVFGFGFSGAGAGLAVTGVAEEKSTSAQQQYGTTTPNTTPPTLVPESSPAPEGQVQGEIDESAPVPAEEEGPAVAGETDEAGVQENRQLGVEEGGDELPFTGFAAIPVLLLGLALLTAGFVLRRRSGADSL